MPNRNEEIEKLISYIKSGHFTGDTITAHGISTDELIDLIAAIRVRPGLSKTIKFLDLANLDVRKQGSITAIPRLNGFTGLKIIILAGNKLRSVPEGWLDDCPALEELYLHRNNLMILPEKLFKNCKVLKSVNLHCNDLATLPATLFDGCKSLENLYLSNNKLIALSEQLLKDCVALQLLDLSSNMLQRPPEGLLDTCVALSQLYLNGNQITALPAGLLDKCLGLKQVIIVENKLTEIPLNFIANCKKLTSFIHDVPVAKKPVSDPLHPKATKPTRPKPLETVTITAAEHAELLKNKLKTDELAQTIAAQAASLADIKLQLRDLNRVPLAVVVKPEVTPEAKALFAKADSLESKFAVKLQDSRATTVNVLLEQANALVPQNHAQNKAIINMVKELIWRTCKAEERAANAEQIALMAVAELRNFEAQTKQSLEFISQNMTENETFLYEAIVRINKLGNAFTVLSAEIGKNNQYATICNALNEGCHQGAATFIVAFVAKFTTEDTFSKLALNKKFKFDYGTFGMVSDALVTIANLVPVAGVGAFATAVQMTVRTFEDRKKISSAKKVINTTGKIVGGAEELATRIAISILQLNGNLIAKCPPDVANTIAKLCFDAAIKYITAAPKEQTEISAEEIAYAIMNGKFLDRKSAYSGYILSFDSTGKLLTTRAKPNNDTKPLEWLSETLLEYGNNPERFDAMLALPSPRRASSIARRPTITTAFDALKIDVQNREEPAKVLAPHGSRSRIAAAMT